MRCLSTIKSWTPPTMDCKIKKWNAFWMVSAKVFIFYYKLIRSCELRSKIKTPTFVFKKQLKWKPRLLKSKDNERKYSETHARGTYLEET